jgi:hypothetical protein
MTMIKLSKLVRGANVQTLAIGIGAAVLAPVVFSMVNGTLRPFARSLVKTGLQLGGQVKAVTAEARESFDDMVAEVQDEISNEHQGGVEDVSPEETQEDVVKK